MEKIKFWAVSFGFIVFLWILVPDQEAEDSVQYPVGTTATNPKTAGAAQPEELPSPMYADQAMQRLIDSGSIEALKGVDLSPRKAAQPSRPPEVVASVTPAGQPATFRVQPIRFNTGRGVLPLLAGIADTPELRSRGLMYYRTWPAKMHGVLFITAKDELFNMWMKNTYLPLDMIFMNKTGTVVHIAENTATQSEALVSSQQPASLVLEIPAGSAKAWQIAVGDKLLLPLSASTTTAH